MNGETTATEATRAGADVGGPAATMAQAAAFRHGGDLAAAAAAYPDAPRPWIDLSTGINPHPYPPPPLTADDWGRLPGKAQERALRRAAGGFFGASSDDCVLAAPGTQSLIQLLPRLLPAVRRIAVLSPTYAEHAAAWRAAGRTVVETTAPETGAVEKNARGAGAFATDLAATGLSATGEKPVAADALPADALLTVNPNNPDGRIVAPGTLLQWADAQAARGGVLIVDEAFADATPHLSVAAHAGRPGLIVLRSFGKFFGLAGARLGFMLAPPDLAAQGAAALGPWAVSGPACAVGIAAYGDAAWAMQTRRRLAAAAARLDATLTAAGYEIVGGTDLFRLVGCADGPALFDRLARAGIWSRPFVNLPRCVRLGLPPDDEAFARLADALSAGR